MHFASQQIQRYSFEGQGAIKGFIDCHQAKQRG
jgi:hypothetical protein